MAKLRPKSYNVSHDFKPIGIRVQVRRLGNVMGSEHRFQACVTNLVPHTTSSRDFCSIAKNPRKAMARVLHKAATAIGKRSGAFAGHRRRRRRRR